MRLANKARLRNTLKKLAAIGLGPDDGHDHATAAQEALDFLAMLAGIAMALGLMRMTGMEMPKVDCSGDLCRS